jgi:hypothetical protein
VLRRMPCFLSARRNADSRRSVSFVTAVTLTRELHNEGPPLARDVTGAMQVSRDHVDFTQRHRLPIPARGRSGGGGRTLIVQGRGLRGVNHGSELLIRANVLRLV